MRGADGNPHAVELQECVVERIPSGEARAVPMGEVRVDVPPARDLFVPFEAGIAELEPGWYAVRATIRVDAGRTWTFSSRGFAVPWPREQVRRGTVKVGQSVRAGRERVAVDGVELRADCAVVSWRAEGGEAAAVDVELLADGREIERIPAEARPLGPRPDHGPQVRSVFYPVARSARALVVRALDRAGGGTGEIELPLG
jgi:hypothetical protein